ncbi:MULTISPECIES: site-specific integrase [unclassified Streptomyces]|uniref:site-specific integrase n=1 Tax=unclassified Streptomyces TaxID=2593676 RepID=UPI00237BC71A|nr:MULTISPECIES: site-specific integrase [unclassified Streptomyces]MDX3402433.1 site-specific integrase [Streptomyces sp. ME01-18h]
MLYLKELMARDSSPLTPRSYGMDLLRWFRFLWVRGIEWDRASREDARDFMLWMKVADKPVRVHWRHRGKVPSEIPPPRSDRPAPGTPNPVTGKPTVGTKYSPRTRAHCETVLRQFYDFHLDGNVGALLVNPFPLVRERRSVRPEAAAGHEDRPQASARRLIPRVHRTTQERDRHQNPGPGLVLGSGGVGSGRPRPVGGMGRPLPGQRSRVLDSKGRPSAQGPDGSTHS